MLRCGTNVLTKEFICPHTCDLARSIFYPEHRKSVPYTPAHPQQNLAFTAAPTASPAPTVPFHSQVWLLGAVLQCPTVKGKTHPMERSHMLRNEPWGWSAGAAFTYPHPNTLMHTLHPLVPWPRTPWGHPVSSQILPPGPSLSLTGNCSIPKMQCWEVKGGTQTLEAAHSPPPQCWWDSMCLPQHILWVQGPQGDTGDSFFSFSMCWLNNSEVVADDEEISWSWEETEGVKGKSIPQPLG